MLVYIGCDTVHGLHQQVSLSHPSFPLSCAASSWCHKHCLLSFNKESPAATHGQFKLWRSTQSVASDQTDNYGMRTIVVCHNGKVKARWLQQ